MQREEAIREWAIEMAEDIAIERGLHYSVDDVLADAQKIVDFITEKSSKPNMP